MLISVHRNKFSMHYDYRHGGVTDDLLKKNISQLLSYHAVLGSVVRDKKYDSKEASLVTPFDKALLKNAEEGIKALMPVRHVVVVGIGGSSMGIEALYAALKGPATPALHVLDVLDANHMYEIVEALRQVPATDIAIVIISKSGSTTETLANADVLLAALGETHVNEILHRTICVGNENTPLARFALEKGLSYVAIPEMVGGRFSVFSAVGLVPMLLLDFDVTEFIEGACAYIEKDLLENTIEKNALVSGAVLASHIATDCRIYALFSEQSRLDSLLRWYQQLIAESLGKVNPQGRKTGIAPIVMTPRELHSTAQLYLSGFEGVFTEFVQGENAPSIYTISNTDFGSMVHISGSRTYERIPKAIMEGVHAAYEKEALPHATVSLEHITAASIGTFMAHKMLEVMYAAHLLGIDAFDQPHVELYKKETRTILEN